VAAPSINSHRLVLLNHLPSLLNKLFLTSLRLYFNCFIAPLYQLPHSIYLKYFSDNSFFKKLHFCCIFINLFTLGFLHTLGTNLSQGILPI